MLAQFKKKMVSNWHESGTIHDRDLAAAKSLPWDSIAASASTMMVGTLGFIGAVIGFFLGFILGSIAGAFIGFCLGFVLRSVTGLCVMALVALIPTPFAWAARRLGYA
jgi:hypothetical protein